MMMGGASASQTKAPEHVTHRGSNNLHTEKRVLRRLCLTPSPLFSPSDEEPQVVSLKAGEGGGRREQTENHTHSPCKCTFHVEMHCFQRHFLDNIVRIISCLQRPFSRLLQSQAFSLNFFSRCTNNMLMFSIKHNGNQEICYTDKTICFQSSCVFHNKCLETVQAAERKLRQITLSSSVDGF